MKKKTSKDRLAKYTASIVGDVVKNRIDAQKDFMVANYGAHLDNLGQLSENVKQIIESEPSCLKMCYHSAGNEVWRIKRIEDKETRKTELKIWMMKWAKRGLKKKILEAIKKVA